MDGWQNWVVPIVTSVSWVPQLLEQTLARGRAWCLLFDSDQKKQGHLTMSSCEKREVIAMCWWMSARTVHRSSKAWAPGFLQFLRKSLAIFDIGNFVALKKNTHSRDRGEDSRWDSKEHAAVRFWSEAQLETLTNTLVWTSQWRDSQLWSWSFWHWFAAIRKAPFSYGTVSWGVFWRCSNSTSCWGSLLTDEEGRSVLVVSCVLLAGIQNGWRLNASIHVAKCFLRLAKVVHVKVEQLWIRVISKVIDLGSASSLNWEVVTMDAAKAMAGN